MQQLFIECFAGWFDKYAKSSRWYESNYSLTTVDIGKGRCMSGKTAIKKPATGWAAGFDI